MRPLKHYASKVHESLSSSGVDGEGNRKLAVNVIDEAIARLARRIDSQFDASGRRTTRIRADMRAEGSVLNSKIVANDLVRRVSPDLR
jgi:hypothetical protein